MQSVDLQACLGFLQAIHFSAKVANVNKEVCQSLSRVLGRIRPCLEEVDMAEPENGVQQNSSLRMIEMSLESIHVAIGRFSTMGQLQSVLEAQAMCDNFSKSRDTMIKALENLAESRVTCSTKDWRDDVQRICEFLKGLCFADSNHLQTAKSVHSTARQIVDGDISENTGQVIIRSQLLADRPIGPKDMQEEIQGLERELSRARVEKDQHEIEELHTIIRALKQVSSDTEQDSRPQPPVEYLCPISQGIMKDPVVLVETGQTYDRKYIEEWFNRGNRTCPATKQSVTELNLTPNYALKSLASSWLDVNSCGDEAEDEDAIFFQHGRGEKEADAKADNLIPDSQSLKPVTGDSLADGGYTTMIDCGYSTMQMPHVSHALKSTTSSSVDSTSLIAKKGIESCGASRESYSGKQNQLYPTKTEDLKATTPKTKPLEESSPTIHTKRKAMQTANIVNPLATTAPNAALNFGGLRGDGVRHSAATMSVPSSVPKLALATRVHAKFAELAETRSTADHYEASTPRSTYSELPRRMTSAAAGTMGLSDGIQALRAARRLQFEIDGAEEQTPRSTRSTNKLLFRTEGRPGQYVRMPTSIKSRRTAYATPSVCSGVSKASRGEREADLRQYDELDKVENGSDAGTEQQPTDEAEEDWIDGAEFDAASLTTIGSSAPKYASSMMSFRPTGKKAANICGEFLQGATNVIFGENEDEDEDGNSSMAEEEDTNDISLPVLANLLKTNDPELAASLASDLAIKAQTDPAMLQDIPRMDIVPSLVKLLSLPSNAVKSACARALGVIGERNPEAKMQILNCGAIPILSRLNKQAEEESNDAEEGSLEDVAGATRFALSALSGNARDAFSVDVSPQMLIELLASPDADMQASSVLELLEKLNSVYADVVLKELTDSSVLMSLVDVLEHSEEDVQFAAAEILSRMIFHDQKTQKELSQSIGIVSKLLRLIKQGGSDCTSCKAAAAQVIRGLAHNNAKIREDVLKRGVIPEFASLLCCNDTHARETAAWMLGTMASHSQNGQDEVACCDQAMFMLQTLAADGSAQEKVAAKFALRAVNIETGYDDDDELSSPIVIHSLQVGTKEVKIAAAWELCRMANSNQWSQIEIFECGGVTALLGYLKARPGPDGIQACLSTLVKLASNEARVAAQISQEGGVLMAVRLLKSAAVPDKKPVIQLLTLLAEKCPVHQQEAVSSGAVPVLVDLLFSEEAICKASSQALCCLIQNDLSVIASSVAESATPLLLDIIANPDSPSFSMLAAVQLVGKMGEATYDCQQIVVQQGGVEVLMPMMHEADDPEVMIAATKAVKSLSNKQFREQGVGAFPRLVQILETTATQRKPRTPGLVQMNEYVPTSPSTTTMPSHIPSSGFSSDHSSRTLTRKASTAGAMAMTLPIVPESVVEESENEESDGTESATLQAESPESPLSRTTYDPMPKKTTFEVCFNDSYSDYPESVQEECERKSQYNAAPPSVASSVKRAPIQAAVQEHTPRKTSYARKKDMTLNHIVENLREGQGQTSKRSTDATIGKLRNLVSVDRTAGSRLLQSGTVGLLVDRLRNTTCR